MSMEPLDGNAIAGSLYEYFGSEMTTVTGSCAVRTLLLIREMRKAAPRQIATRREREFCIPITYMI